MKRIKQVIVAILLLLTVTGYSQLSEGFEAGTGPVTSPSGGTWVLSSGTWAIINKEGINKTWTRTTLGSSVIPPRTGNYAAYLDREAGTPTPEDWLVTPAINVSGMTDPNLTFYSRHTVIGNQGGVYKVLFSNTSQTDISNFNDAKIVSVESDYVAGVYGKMTVPIPQKYITEGNGVLYIAFVMIGNDKDRWLIDDVLVADKCLMITNQEVSNNTGNSFQLSWQSPPGISKWEVQVLDQTESLTDVGSIASTNTNYNISSTTKGAVLQQGKEYRTYVRSVCPVGDSAAVSDWVGPYFIRMAEPGMLCSLPVVIPPSLPYIGLEQTYRSTSTFISAPGNNCGIGSAEYIGKGYTVYSYTPTSNGVINIDVKPDKNTTAVFVYGSCNDIGVNCLAGSANNDDFNKSIKNLPVVSGNTYYIVVAASSNNNYQSRFALTISAIDCSSIQANFNINCTSDSNFTAVANITNLGGTTVIASLYKNGFEVSTQTISTPGLVSFPGNTSNDGVHILLKSSSTPPCILLSNKLTKEFCPPANDNCANAQVLISNTQGDCNSVSGRLTGATSSPEPSSCPGDKNDDVWYEFTAIGETHVISFLDIEGSDTNINHTLYKGSVCNNLEELYCDTDNYSIAKNLVVGQTYKIRVYTDSSTPSLTTFKVCIIGYVKTCMDTNDQSAIVKDLFIDLINYLKSLPSPYLPAFDCPQLTALAPYISDPNPRIYNFEKSGVGSNMRFSFSNHPGVYDIQISSSQDLIATDINLFSYVSPAQQEVISITYSNGITSDKGNSIRHINFCPDFCVPITGKIKISSGLSCVVSGVANVFSLQTTSSAVASYSWSFYDAGMNHISTSSLSSPSITFTANGTHFARLIITDSKGCTTKFEKYFLVSATCTNYCTETNPKSEMVKDLFINLVNHLLKVYTLGGTVPSPYFCSELADLTPFITDGDGGIYNTKYTNGILTFSFANHGVNDIDVTVVNNGQITDINLSPFTPTGNILTLYKSTYLNGEPADIAIKHVNFCSENCGKLTGNITLRSGSLCIDPTKSHTFNFISTVSNITSYSWTFYRVSDNTILSTSTSANPTMTYPAGFSGKVKVNLVVNYGLNCSANFCKIFSVGCAFYAPLNPIAIDIKESITKVINDLHWTYTKGGIVTFPYTTPELTKIGPHVLGGGVIKNVSYIDNILKINFVDHNPNITIIKGPIRDLFLDGPIRQEFDAIAEDCKVINVPIGGIDFNPPIFCPPLVGTIKLGSGESCIPVNTSQSFHFTGSTASVTTYSWTFYNSTGTYALATSQSAVPSMTYNTTGNYLVKLVINSKNLCKKTFYKTVTVSTNCGNDNGGGSDGNNGPNCTEVNSQALVVKELYKTFLNSLLVLDGSIPNGYTNAALTALSPYITDTDPKIYNVNYTAGVLSFSFSQGEAQPDIVIADYGTIVDINLVNYTTTGSPDYIITYANGIQYTKHKAKHINFCPAATDSCNLTGDMVLGSGLTCIVKGVASSFNFTTTATNITGYKWTFYAVGDTTSILSTSTDKQPSITYTTEGDYKVKLVVSYGLNCSKTFYRLFKVNTICNNCVETNTETPLVKKAIINLVNHLYNIYSNGGTVPHGYSCPESVALSKYISVGNNNSNIEVSYNNSRLEINTVEPYSTIFKSYSVMTAPLVDIQINEDFDPNFPFAYMECIGVLANGNYNEYMYLYGINLCPVTECLPLFGELKLGSGESCIAVNSAQSFHFTGNTANIASYAWTFYNKEGTFVLLTSSFKMPYMTYNSTGDYLVKLEVTSTTGCKDVFYKTITVSANCGNNNDGGGDGSNGDNCTEVNQEAKMVKHLYMTFLNSLLPLNGNIPNGFSNMELSSLAPYITDINPKIYNVNYTGNILSFSFSQSDTQPDVIMATNNGAIVDINLLSYTTTGNHNYILTYKNGVQYKTHKANHINFCPNLEPCKSHVAFVFDESSSFKGNDVSYLKIHMHGFVDQQVGSNMTVSFTGLSDSDTYNRTDHIYGKITAENKAVFHTWIDNYKSGYSGRSIGVSPNSDYWASGLKQAMNGYELKPEIVILFTDGSQTADVPGLKQIVSSIINDEDSHLYVYGIDSGFYVSDTAIPLDPNNYINTDISDVTPRLKSSIKFLMGLHPDEFPASSKDDLLAGVYFGYENFNNLELEDRFFSNKLTQANIGCGGEVILKDFCYDCQTFQPSPGQTYWISAWAMEEQNVQVKTYTNAVLKIIFLNQAKTKVGEISLLPSGDIIDGWQRFASKVEIPETATIMEIELENLSPNIPVYFDDIRVHPINGSMKSFVYDPETFRLMAEQDDNNYSTFYEYDQEGGLIRIKKETSKGIKTIQESRSGSVIKQVGN